MLSGRRAVAVFQTARPSMRVWWARLTTGAVRKAAVLATIIDAETSELIGWRGGGPKAWTVRTRTLALTQSALLGC